MAADKLTKAATAPKAVGGRLTAPRAQSVF